MKSALANLSLIIFASAAHAQTLKGFHPANKKIWARPTEQVNRDEAWKFAKGRGVVVAVLDTGVDLKQARLKGKLLKNSAEIPGNRMDDDENGFIDDVDGWNFFSNSANVQDDHGHGTHVAGIIVDESLGMAPQSQILPVKIGDAQGHISTENLLKAMKYATLRGAKVLNLSLRFANLGAVDQKLIDDMMNFARRYDVMIVTAAGNDSVDSGIKPIFPANIMGDNHVAVCSVGATDEQSTFSNFNHLRVQLCAPGEDIYSWGVPSLHKTQTDTGLFRFDSGTSMSAPFVAGAAALLYSFNLKFKSFQVRSYLMDMVRVVPGLVKSAITSGVLDSGRSLKKAWCDRETARHGLAPPTCLKI